MAVTICKYCGITKEFNDNHKRIFCSPKCREKLHGSTSFGTVHWLWSLRLKLDRLMTKIQGYYRFDYEERIRMDRYDYLVTEADRMATAIKNYFRRA